MPLSSAAALLATLLLLPCSGQEYDVDVLVYGATPGGVLAADAAAGEAGGALRVALLDPRALVGGCMAGGLANTDVGSDARVLGGRTRSFFQRVSAAYGGAGNASQYTFEPKVAEAIFRDYFLASKPNLALHSSTRIVRVDAEPAPGGGRRLARLHTAAGAAFTARVVVDASYEGFLLPLANVSFAYGREPAAQYGERAGGVSGTAGVPGAYTVQPQLFAGVDPFVGAPGGAVLPLVQAQPPGPLGSGDARTQAYMYRVTTTAVPGAFLQPWPRPPAYNASQFELFRRLVAARNGSHVLGACSNLPRGKCDSNSQYFDQSGPGFSWDYPRAVAAGDWAAQQAVWDAHRDFQLGLAYFLQNDPALPPAVRANMGTFGLPLDEYPLSTGTPVAHFPPQLYVRETLRMVSDFVLTERDRVTDLAKPDSIGMGDYTIDVLPVSRFPLRNASTGAWGTALEGGVQAPSFLTPGLPPFQIPYRAIVPRRAEAVNLLVPGALSASHLGFCAVRVEPAWMVLGESAGVAAALAAGSGGAVQDVDVPALQARLRELGQVLEL
jgi:hypothetical protein